MEPLLLLVNQFYTELFAKSVNTVPALLLRVPLRCQRFSRSHWKEWKKFPHLTICIVHLPNARLSEMEKDTKTTAALFSFRFLSTMYTRLAPIFDLFILMLIPRGTVSHLDESFAKFQGIMRCRSIVSFNMNNRLHPNHHVILTHKSPLGWWSYTVVDF